MTIARIRRWGNEPSQVKKKWVLGVNAALATLYFGGFFGLYRYVQNRDAEADEKALAQCLTRVESRLEIRGMFLTTFDVIEELNGQSAFVERARSRLDERYPELTLSDC